MHFAHIFACPEFHAWRALAVGATTGAQVFETSAVRCLHSTSTPSRLSHHCVAMKRTATFPASAPHFYARPPTRPPPVNRAATGMNFASPLRRARPPSPNAPSEFAHTGVKHLKDPSFSTLTDAKSATRSSDERDDDSAASLALSEVARLRAGENGAAPLTANLDADVDVEHDDVLDDAPSMAFMSRAPYRQTPSTLSMGSRRQRAAQKHRSLGTLPRADYFAHPEIVSPVAQRRAGGLRHRSLLRRERSRDAFARATPSFLEALAERVRSVSPSPQSLSSDPAKVIAAMPDAVRGSDTSSSLRNASGGQKSFSLGTLPAHAPSISPSVSRSSGLAEAATPRSHNLSSTSLRRVLSLGRGRLDSDAHSVVSEPVVYAESAHIADDIWIAPKELYTVERRIAANNERRAHAKRIEASRNADRRHVERLNRQRQLCAVVPERMQRRRFVPIPDPDEPVAMEIDSDPAPQPQPDPSEFHNADMSSRLIRLFFNSPTQNPVAPSAAKRAEQHHSRSGSSRLLMFRKPVDRSRANLHFDYSASCHSVHSSATATAHATPTMKSGAGSFVGPEPLPTDFDIRARMRGLARFANLRRWLRSRTYRKHQRRPGRHQREAAF